MNPKRLTPNHIMIKMTKVKKRILTAAREKQRATHARESALANFSVENWQARGDSHDIF